MTSYEQLSARAAAVMTGTYGIAPLALDRGRGCTVWDTEGREYLDLVAGIAVSALGHAHPRVIEAVSAQLARLGHVSNLYLTRPAVELAERLSGLAGGDARTFFCNSGAEANETAIKLARRRGRAVRPDKLTIVAAEGGFHGRTLGALSVTGQPAKRAPFEPLPGHVVFVPYGDADALAAAMDHHTAAILLEPIQGESGVHVPADTYLAAARRVADDHDALLILDEVQTGVGRTGAWFAHQHVGVRPDVMTLAKGLGGGLPIGACMAFGPAGGVLTAGDHGSTFGGNPVVCTAALAVLDVVEEQSLVPRAGLVGDRFAAAVEALGLPEVETVRGRGLMRAIGLSGSNARALELAARQAGFLVNAIGDSTVRLVPPLVVTESELDSFVRVMPALAGHDGTPRPRNGRVR
jgi:acetylornithine/N-succinyldiaminopimelate aminotransferase